MYRVNKIRYQKRKNDASNLNLRASSSNFIPRLARLALEKHFPMTSQLVILSWKINAQNWSIEFLWETSKTKQKNGKFIIKKPIYNFYWTLHKRNNKDLNNFSQNVEVCVLQWRVNSSSSVGRLTPDWSIKFPWETWKKKKKNGDTLWYTGVQTSTFYEKLFKSLEKYTVITFMKCLTKILNWFFNYKSRKVI